MCNTTQILEQWFRGEVPEANALAQLLHCYQTSPSSVIDSLKALATTVVSNADASSASSRAVELIICAAAHLDRQSAPVAAGPGPNGSAAQGTEVRRCLLEHALELTCDSDKKAPKEKAVRARGCALVAAFAPAAPGHQAAEEKLIELAVDKIPSIRERAVRGLAALSSSARVEHALIARMTDTWPAVRATAVKGVPIKATTMSAFLGRIDDIEACVRAELYSRLGQQPAAVQQLGPAAMGRLLAGLVDRSSFVRAAATEAVESWCKAYGGAVRLLGRCDVVEDEELGEVIGKALILRFPEEGKAAVEKWVGLKSTGHAPTSLDQAALVLMARLAATAMSEEERDETIDIPIMLERATSMLETFKLEGVRGKAENFMLRQLLHMLALVDICEEGVRRQARELAEAVLITAPIRMQLAEEPMQSRLHHSAFDLAVVLIRKSFGLGQQVQTAKHQHLEAQCSTHLMLLISDLCGADEAASESQQADEDFTSRLSCEIHDLELHIAAKGKRQDELQAMKKQAIFEEDFLKAEHIKKLGRVVERELAELVQQRDKLKIDRDGVCLRILEVLGALLRWSNSDLRKDHALIGAIEHILKPMINLPALSEAVSVQTVMVLCLFCVREGTVAKRHWCLLLTLLRCLWTASQTPGSSAYKKVRAEAILAAKTLSDCARLFGGVALDRDEQLSAAMALAATPFSCRQVVVEPLCSWFVSLGHLFFEEHLLEPVLEVHWALGWLLVEAFKQRRRSWEEQGDSWWCSKAAPSTPGAGRRGLSWVRKPGLLESFGADRIAETPKKDKAAALEEEENGPEAVALASRLLQFFSLLPKLPGRHGSALLCLALESVAESGLWRRSMLVPQTVKGETRWLRGFSWPKLFAFAHERVPQEMRIRLWKCALQICLASPEAAQYAEIHFPLEVLAHNAPAGSTALLEEALELGLPRAIYDTLVKKLPKEEAGMERSRLLLPKDKALTCEAERRRSLIERGIDINAWAPADVELPDIAPIHHRLRVGRGQQTSSGVVGRPRIRARRDSVLALLPPPLQEAPKQPAPPPEPASPPKKRRCIDWEAKLAALKLQEQGAKPVVKRRRDRQPLREIEVD